MNLPTNYLSVKEAGNFRPKLTLKEDEKKKTKKKKKKKKTTMTTTGWRRQRIRRRKKNERGRRKKMNSVRYLPVDFLVITDGFFGQ